MFSRSSCTVMNANQSAQSNGEIKFYFFLQLNEAVAVIYQIFDQIGTLFYNGLLDSFCSVIVNSNLQLNE